MSGNNKQTYKGKFRPKNPQKYKGDPNNIVYRSSWEAKVMNYFDQNPDIISWASEELVIPYLSPIDNRWHRYFPDFTLRTKSGTFVVEVKPEKQSRPPQVKSRKTKQYIHEVMTWGVNQAKWKAAIDYCKDRQWKFIVMVSTDGTEFKYLSENQLLLN